LGFVRDDPATTTDTRPQERRHEEGPGRPITTATTASAAINVMAATICAMTHLPDRDSEHVEFLAPWSLDAAWPP
jgi:hypothetical protein